MFRDPMEVFRDFFGGRDPFAEMFGKFLCVEVSKSLWTLDYELVGRLSVWESALMLIMEAPVDVPIPPFAY